MRNIFYMGLVILLVSCNSTKEQDPYCKVDRLLFPFSLSDVRLTESPFNHAMEMDGKWILSFDPDRLLSGFRQEAGLKPKAPKYGGWESGPTGGQIFGHYLSACAFMYAATGNIDFLNKIEYCVNELDTCQQALGTGLVSGFPGSVELFGQIVKGEITTKGFDINGRAVPLYIMHKLYAGLIDAYRYTGNPKAYDVLIKSADWFLTVFEPLTDEQLQTILVAEHGGINEAFANLYGLTGNERYLRMAERLNHQFVMEPLAKRQDKLVGLHANTQIPKVVGVIREFELTGDSTYWNTAVFFWDRVVHHHSYVIGGNSEAEHFGMPDRVCDRITDKTCETCNTYNMLKLTNHLYQLTGASDKADYYERALYNHILASQNPKDGMICYMSPLNSGGRKDFSSSFDSFWCCVGTGIENHARYGEFIYFTDMNEDLHVNLFIPSVLTWKKRGVVVKQETDYPQSDNTIFEFTMDEPKEFILNLRFPSWAEKGYSLKINGKEITQSCSPGQYLQVKRLWKNGDVVEYTIPKSIHAEAIPGDSTVKAYLYGPLVLAGLMPDGQETAPVVVGCNQIRLSKPSPEGLNFVTTSVFPGNLNMIPYYQAVDKRIAVYFPHYSPEEWEVRKDEFMSQQDKENWLRSHTVSFFQPGEMQPERDHNFTGNQIELGELEGRKFRKAMDGGWFTFQMETLPECPMSMVCTYWGDLGDIYKFNVFVDDVQVGSTEIIHWWGRKFVDKTYKLPFELTRGKKQVLVKVQALNDKSVAGPLFGCRMLK